MELKNYEKKSDNLIIIDNGSTNKDIIDYVGKDLWVIAKKYYRDGGYRPRLLVEIHSIENLREKEAYYRWLCDLDIPMLCQSESMGFKVPVVYPIEYVLDKYKTKFILNSLSYMVILAIEYDYKEIEIYEANMITYTHDLLKTGVEFWLGVAAQKGIVIKISPYSDLLKCDKLYGYEVDNSLAVANEKYRMQLLKEIRESEDILEIKKKVELLEENRIQYMKNLHNRYMHPESLIGSVWDED